MFKDNRVAITIILLLSLVVGTLDYQDQVEMEKIRATR